MAAVPWGSYVTPRLVLSNESDAPMTCDGVWLLDGNEIPFAPVSLQPGDAISLCLSASTAEALNAGEHRL